MSSSDNPQLEPQPPASTDSQMVNEAAFGTPVPPTLEGTQIPAEDMPPPRDPVWSGWDVLSVAFLTFLALVVSQFLTTVIAWFLFYHQRGFRDVLQNPLLGLVGEFLAYIAVAFYMVALVEGKYHVQFLQAIRWNWPRKAAPLLGLGVLTVSLDFLSRFLPMPKSTPFDELFSHPVDAVFIAIFSVTLGPLMEELFFRGFLYPVLARRIGVSLAVVFTAIPFGLMHYLQYRSWAAVLVVTLVGVVLTVVRVVTRSVAASFLVHVGYNATLMLLTAAATGGFRHFEQSASWLG